MATPERRKRRLILRLPGEPKYMAVGRVVALLLVVVVMPALGAYPWFIGLLVVAITLIFALIQARPDIVRDLNFLVAIGVFGVAVYALDGHHAEKAFYEIAAQVLPVLFLALAVESRLSVIGQEETEQRLRLILIYALGIGEVTSLVVLATGQDGNNSLGYVAGALAAATVSVVTFAVTSGIDDKEK
jgi:hypothetical protein